MDILCPKCGEPWDCDELREEKVSWKDFIEKGCEAFLGCKHNSTPLKEAADLKEMYYMFDNPWDAASMVEDLGLSNA